ncbi:MAG: NAD-dependent epimerase/dehydratase family protein [Candidatus Bilamarchaeum sp.]|jgi:nucleoside-diphosphate-sugar epimerase
MPRPKRKQELATVTSNQLTLTAETKSEITNVSLPKVDSKKRKIYLTGANGRLGREILKLLPSAIPIVRNSRNIPNEVISDFSEISLKRILSEADVVIHAAGSVNTLNSNELWESNVSATKRLVSATPRNCRIIFISSISVYGKKLSKIPADESTLCIPDSDYSRSKYEAEKIIKTHPKYSILRLGTLYGLMYDDYLRILKRLHKGTMKLIGNGENRIPFTHISDAALAIVNAATSNSPSDLYVITGISMSQKEIYKIACNFLTVPIPTQSVSLSYALMLALISELFSKLTGKRPSLTKEQVSVLGYDRVFDCSKAAKELNFKPRPLEEGIKEMVSHYNSKL